MLLTIIKYLLIVLSLLVIVIVSYLPTINDLQLTTKPQQLFHTRKPKGLIGQLNAILIIITIGIFAILLLIN